MREVYAGHPWRAMQKDSSTKTGNNGITLVYITAPKSAPLVDSVGIRIIKLFYPRVIRGQIEINRITVCPGIEIAASGRSIGIITHIPP